MAVTVSTGFQSSRRMLRQMLPSRSMLGWYTLVRHLTCSRVGRQAGGFAVRGWGESLGWWKAMYCTGQRAAQPCDWLLLTAQACVTLGGSWGYPVGTAKENRKEPPLGEAVEGAVEGAGSGRVQYAGLASWFGEVVRWRSKLITLSPGNITTASTAPPHVYRPTHLYSPSSGFRVTSKFMILSLPSGKRTATFLGRSSSEMSAGRAREGAVREERRARARRDGRFEVSGGGVCGGVREGRPAVVVQTAGGKRRLALEE